MRLITVAGSRDTQYITSANLDLVRSIYAPWERGDFSAVDWAHHEIEYVIVGGPSPGAWRGLAGMAEANRDFLSAWEDVRVVAPEYRELDTERVLVLHRRSGRGKLSGLKVEQIAEKGAHLFHLRDGRVTRLVGYHDADHALADLGLTSEADSASA
jgi:ketosteroid isomerase-like protein